MAHKHAALQRKRPKFPGKNASPSALKSYIKKAQAYRRYVALVRRARKAGSGSARKVTHHRRRRRR